ncbi:MAG: coproporphyrinogen III oxidase family protein [Acidobacteria bacterium]|nr:MAG: coproporphyrinogen III oxidase family protein [Acidobacteriota bacterium]REJ99225.1 MAG: coproporphyrinogen III oxidase family protein [Acidobacteriota bacterium]REK16054.1 MAG: coproporphyrinogen III oxidase family protein [Acidobacteriota bacterium]REK43735.1 MAG: coproporphyrinogen III oxidase family protein [Acidobacteriota bacterium]
MPAGVYIHVPFCKSRCSYCDFATDVYRNDEAVERYLRAVLTELEDRKPKTGDRLSLPDPNSVLSPQSSVLPAGRGRSDSVHSPQPSVLPARGGLVDTIYFGGGTPSLLNPGQLERILKAVHERFEISEDREITVEMNPATVTLGQLEQFRAMGVNRASFGVQTFNDRSLKLLARGHDADDARSTYKTLRKAGFENISFDLIAGLPHQTIDDWKANLEEAVSMSPEHISLYLLEIHEATPLAEQVRSGRQPLPDEELAAEMYELMLERLEKAGYRQYEISNFCKEGFESRHNLKYWDLDPVIGFGVSSHSFDGGRRWVNVRDTMAYVRTVECGDSPVVEIEELPEKQLKAEFTFLKLRLTKGLDLKEYRSRFGSDLTEEFGPEIAEFRELGLVELTESDVMRLTQKGRLYSNEVFGVFV